MSDGQWESMDSAPKDGRQILVGFYNGGHLTEPPKPFWEYYVVSFDGRNPKNPWLMMTEYVNFVEAEWRWRRIEPPDLRPNDPTPFALAKANEAI